MDGWNQAESMWKEKGPKISLIILSEFLQRGLLRQTVCSSCLKKNRHKATTVQVVMFSFQVKYRLREKYVAFKAEDISLGNPMLKLGTDSVAAAVRRCN